MKWQHDRAALIFQTWKEYVAEKKAKQDQQGQGRDRKHGLIIDPLDSFSNSRPPSSPSTSTAHLPFSTSSPPNSPPSSPSQSSFPPQSSRRQGMIRVNQTRGASLISSSSSISESKGQFVLERFGWYTGPHLHELIHLVEEGSAGRLSAAPSMTEFQLCCRTIWSRHSPEEAISTSLVSGTTATERASAALEGEEAISPEVALQNAILGMDTNKALQAILDGVSISPALIESTSVHIGDKYIPLVAVLLSRCVPYVAKRILLNDCKEMVMRCNNPLTALLIGHHISRSVNFLLRVSE
jgi:hypothetical protein